jgi:hypothetical protein
MGHNRLRTCIYTVIIVALVFLAGDEKHGALVTIGKNSFRSDLAGFANEIGLGQRETGTCGHKRIQVDHATVFPKKGVQEVGTVR